MFIVSCLDALVTAVSVKTRNHPVTSVEFVTEQKTRWISKKGECARPALANKRKVASGSDVAIEFLKAENTKLSHWLKSVCG